MTTLTPSSQEELNQESTGCSENIYRLSMAWFYVIGVVSLLAWLLTFFSIQTYLPFSIITNTIINLLSSDVSPIQIFSINVLPLIRGILPFLFSIQFFCFGYLGYKKNLSAVIIGTTFYFFDSAIHFLLGSPSPAIMNSPALLGLFIGLIILFCQKPATIQKGIYGSNKPEAGADRFIWAFIKVSSVLFVCINCYFFLIFLVIPGKM